MNIGAFIKSTLFSEASEIVGHVPKEGRKG